MYSVRLVRNGVRATSWKTIRNWTGFGFVLQLKGKTFSVSFGGLSIAVQRKFGWKHVGVIQLSASGFPPHLENLEK